MGTPAIMCPRLTSASRWGAANLCRPLALRSRCLRRRHQRRRSLCPKESPSLLPPWSTRANTQNIRSSVVPCHRLPFPSGVRITMSRMVVPRTTTCSWSPLRQTRSPRLRSAGRTALHTRLPGLKTLRIPPEAPRQQTRRSQQVRVTQGQKHHRWGQPPRQMDRRTWPGHQNLLPVMTMTTRLGWITRSLRNRTSLEFPRRIRVT